MLNQLKGVFASFQRHNVRYVVIGGIAPVLHGVPRATFDLDLLIEPTAENAGARLQALGEAGLGTAALTTTQDRLAHEITVFKDFVRIDVQTSTPGLRFEDAWRDRREMQFEGQVFHVASRAHLIASKRASGRPVDLEDLKALGAGE